MDKEISNLDPNPSLLKDTDETIINKKNAGTGFTTVRDSLYNLALYVISKIIPSSGYVKSNGTSLTSTSAIPAADITQDSTHKFVAETTRYNLEDNANNQDGYLKASTDAPTGILNAPSFNHYMSMPNVSNQRLWYDVTLGEAMTANELVCYIGDDRKLYKASTSDPSKLQHQLGLRLASANGLNDPNMFITYGYITLDYALITGYTAGYNGAVWLTSTGALTITKPTSDVVYIGTATRFSSGQVELFVNPEYRDVSTGGGGGISEPTTDGNWLRSKVSSTYSWVEGVLKSTYDSFVSSVNATFAWTKSAGVQSGTTLDWGTTDISTITGSGSVTINSISNLTDGVRNYIISGYSSFGFNTSLIPASSILGNYIAGQTNKLQIINLKDGEFQLIWSNITMSGGGSTNLTYTASPTNGVVNSDTGTDATITIVDGTNAGLVSPSMKSTWDGKRNTYVTDTIATSGSTAIDFTVDGETNITQTGSITFTGSAGATYKEKTYIIKGSRNPAHTFTFVGWVAVNNTQPSPMYDNAIFVWTSGSQVFFCVNVFEPITSSFVFSSGLIVYPELNKIRVYVSGTLDQTVVPNTSWFTVSGKTVSAIALAYNYIEITVTVSFIITDTPTVGYTSGAGRLADGFGNLLTSFSVVLSVNTLLSDSFNRANSTTTLGNADTGQTWQYVSPAVYGISSNQMYCVSATDTGSAVNYATYIDCGNVRQTITLDKIFPISTNQTITRVLLRFTDINNHYRVTIARVTTTVTIIISAVKSGVVGGALATFTAGLSSVSNASVQTRTYSCKIEDYTISVYEGSTLIGAYTDNATDRIAVGNNVGIIFVSTANYSSTLDRIDNFLVTKN